jgi:hypothetical protein
MRALFLYFKAVSGLKINLAKSKLVHVDNVEIVDGLLGILGHEVSSLPMKYLALLLKAFYKAIFRTVLLKR